MHHSSGYPCLWTLIHLILATLSQTENPFRQHHNCIIFLEKKIKLSLPSRVFELKNLFKLENAKLLVLFKSGWDF